MLKRVGRTCYETFTYVWNVFAERKKNLKSSPHYSFSIYMKRKKNKDERLLQSEVKMGLPGFNFDFYNIAICGLLNTGKSALVNSLRGLKAGEYGRHSYVSYSQGCLESLTAGSYLKSRLA